MQNGACSFFYVRMSKSSVSNSTSGDFRLFFSAVIRECAFAVKICCFFFIQFILSLFFPNRLTFVVNVLTDVGFKVRVRNSKTCYH